MRVGLGYDIHQLVKGRKLILGGIEFESELGLLGHSDADVLTHAIMDAILGALALPDIGNLFPDTDPEFLGIYSIDLLDRVVEKMFQRGYKMGNLDSVIICERPKIAPYREKIVKLLADHLKTDTTNVSVKASTSEKLGPTGRSEGIEARAIVYLEEIDA